MAPMCAERLVKVRLRARVGRVFTVRGRPRRWELSARNPSLTVLTTAPYRLRMVVGCVSTTKSGRQPKSAYKHLSAARVERVKGGGLATSRPRERGSRGRASAAASPLGPPRARPPTPGTKRRTGTAESGHRAAATCVAAHAAGGRRCETIKVTTPLRARPLSHARPTMNLSRPT